MVFFQTHVASGEEGGFGFDGIPSLAGRLILAQNYGGPLSSATGRRSRILIFCTRSQSLTVEAG
jgi:hypothetical protein